MTLKLQFQTACLVGLLSLLSACNQESDIANHGLLSEIDFKRPVELELKLKTSDMDKGAKLCKVDSPHNFKCTLSHSSKNLFSQGGEVRVKAKAVFSKKELIDLVNSTKQKYQTEGKFSYAVGGIIK
jgi:hypothetical protein